MTVSFADMPWLVTVTGGDKSDTYGPLRMARAIALRDQLRDREPSSFVEAWAAQLPNTAVVKRAELAEHRGEAHP